MKKLILISLLLVGALSLGKVYATVSHSQWNDPEWSKCESVGSQCGTDNGTQSRTLTCVSGGDSKECSLGTWVDTTYKYADPICPKDYHVQNSGNWTQRCHRNFNWMHPEHKSPIGCPDGYSQSGADCRKVDVAGHFINPETKVEERSCQTGEIDYSACDPEGTCPTECGYQGGEVADGKGGYMKCEATVACDVDQCENIDGMQTEVPDGYHQEDGNYCFEDEKPEPEPKDEPKGKTFHKDTRCLDSTPPAISWIKVEDGSAANNWLPQATWSAEGGDEVEVCFSETLGDPRWCFKMLNDGHQELGHVAADNTGLLGMVQYYANWRTVNGCKSGEWTAVDWFN